MAKPVLYHMPQTRGQTTFWMNEELGCPCDIELINLKAGDQKSPAFLRVNPMGKLPALTHDGQIVTEAAAICAYLADQFPEANLAPAHGDTSRAPYYRWMFFAPSCLEPAMLDKFAGTARENLVATGHGNFDGVVTTMKTAFVNGPWLLGDQFTAADVVFGSALNFATMFGALQKEAPFTAYLERLYARPAYQQAQEKNLQIMKDLGLS